MTPLRVNLGGWYLHRAVKGDVIPAEVVGENDGNVWTSGDGTREFGGSVADWEHGEHERRGRQEMHAVRIWP